MHYTLVYCKGQDNTTPIKSSGSSGSNNVDITGMTAASGDLMIGCCYDYVANPTVTDSSQTQIRSAQYNTAGQGVAYKASVGAFYYTGSSGYSSACAVVVGAAGAAGTVEQEGFRWGVDDDAEADHTWAAAQDADLTAPLDENVLLRVLVNGTDDPATAAYTLRYQKNGSGGYLPVPVGATGTATLDITIASGADDAQQSGTTVTVTGTTIGASLDATTEYVGLRFPGVTIPQGATITAAYLSVVPSSTSEDEPNVTITGFDEDDTAAFTTGASNITNRAITTASVTWSSTNLGATGSSYHDSPSLTAVVQEIVDRGGWASGNAMGFRIRGGSGTTRDLTIEAYENAGANPPKLHIEYEVANEVYVATSANITAGGEATTARLTAPSGKTTGDFVTGRRWDDENGTDSIDITTDDYTEVEWCLKAQSPAEASDYYEFRVYAGTSPLDTYTVTPKWTIGGGSTYDDTLTESVTAGQSFTNTAVFVSGVLESATVGDAYAAALTAPAALSESASLGDAFVGAAVQSATLTEDVESGESMAVAAAFVASLSDAATLADGYAPANMMPASLSESVTVADDYAPALTISVTLVESATLDDGVTTGTIYSDDLTESVTAADGYSAVLTITATVTESVTAADAYASVAVMAAALAEALAPSDSFGAALTMSVQLGESSTLGDGYADQHQQSGTDSVTESVTVGDSYDVQGSFADVLIESAELGDTFTAELVIPVTVGEFVSLADAYESARIVTADLDESVAVADSVVAVLQAIEMLAEDVALDDSLLGTISGTLAIDMPHTRRVGPRVMSFGITRVGARRMSFGTTRVGPRRMQFGVRRIGPRTIKGD
jgi:hypothetical protein